MNRVFLLVFAVMYAGSVFARHTDFVSVDTTHTNNDSVRSLSELKREKFNLYAKDNNQVIENDTIARKNNRKIFMPNPQTAMWNALLCPGLGQIYNKRYWKLPIVYGGFAGLSYGIAWNNKYYKLYKQYYRDFSDNNPDTKSYEQLYDKLGKGTITANYLKDKMDNLRRYRDLCIIGTVAFYGLTVLDAFVDASLANFDISEDLSMRLSPTMLPSSENSVNIALKLNLNF